MTAWIPLLIALLGAAWPATAATAFPAVPPAVALRQHPTITLHAEFDGDGRHDEVRAIGRRVVLRLSSPPLTLVLPRRGSWHRLLAHDVDLDGDQDLLGMAEHGLVFWRNEGNGRFTAPAPHRGARLVPVAAAVSIARAPIVVLELGTSAPPPPPARLRVAAFHPLPPRAGPALEARRSRRPSVVLSSRSPRAPPSPLA